MNGDNKCSVKTMGSSRSRRISESFDVVDKYVHRFKDTEGMMARWLHTLHQFQFTIVHRAGCDHGNADGLSRAPTDPCRQCTRVECPRVNTSVVVADQPFDDASVGDSEDDDLIPLQSGED